MVLQNQEAVDFGWLRASPAGLLPSNWGAQQDPCQVGWSARIDRGDFGSNDQAQLMSNECAEPNRLHIEKREFTTSKGYLNLAASHYSREQLPPTPFRLPFSLRHCFSSFWLCSQLGVTRGGFSAAQQQQH